MISRTPFDVDRFLAEVAGARTTDEVKAVWVRALRTTAFCRLDRPARERLFAAAAAQITHTRNSELPRQADAAAGAVNPDIIAGPSGTTHE
jgi:hypothetical protein